MVSQQMIEIILKAQDEASKVVKENEQNVKKFSDTAKQANNQASAAAEKYAQKISATKTQITPLIGKVSEVGQKGKDSFNKLTSSQQDAVTKFNMLDNTTQKTLTSLAKLGTQNSNLVPGADAAIAKLASMDDKVKTFGGSFDYAKSKAELLGTSTDTLKGKLQVVGTGITTYVVNKWDSAKTKVTTLGNYIKTSLGNALTTVRGKIDSLGSSFSGLGGIIASAIGGLGMASIGQLTVGLAMNRERMTALTSATMGSAAAGESFVNTMDKLTDTSLVSLDDLGQAMSTIKMSTGMTNQELQNFATTVNDVGQRAILMGKSGEEAVSLMQAAGRGLNGEFEMLKANFGITKEQLMDLGWSGAANDVEGYQKALDKALEAGGSMDGMMNTTTGKLETLKKNFRVAGRHVGEMFTPYIEQAVGWLNNLQKTCPGLFEALVMISGALSGFATIAPSLSPALQAFDTLVGKGKKVLQFLGLMKAEEGALTAAMIYNSIASKVSAAAHAIYGGIVGVLTGEITLVSAATAVWSAILSMNPIMLVVLAIIALIAVIYEVGKAFGWWSNVSEMLGAIWAGINRLWSAFINHPDVQAAIQAISGAMQWLWSCISGAVKAIMEFFGVSTGGDFDVIGAIITGIGQAWDFVKNAIMAVIRTIGGILDVFRQVISGQMDLQTAIITIWNVIKMNLGPIVLAIAQLVIRLFGVMAQSAVRYVSNLFAGVVRWFSMIPANVWKWLNSTKLKIMTQFVYWVALAKLRAKQFVTTIINFIKTLPRLVYAWLVGVATKIVTAGQQWISNAQAKAKGVVKAVIDYVQTLPQAVYNEFAKIPSKIRDAISAACDAAGQWGRQVVARLKSAMGINSPGYIQNSVVAEFANTVGRIEDQINPAEKTATKFGKAIVNGFGEVDLGMNDLLDDNSSLIVDANSIVSDRYVIDENFNVNHDLNLTLDFKNLPENVDENNLVKIVEKAITNPKTLKKLLNSNVFQDIDLKAKRSIQNKRNRSKGIWNS